MIRVAVANEYNLRRNVGKYREGRYARHLLFGVQRLEPPEFEVEFVGESLQGALNRKPIRFAATLLRAAWAARPADVVYATFTYGGLLAGFLHRAVGRPRRVVTVVHGLPYLLRSRPRVFAWLFRGHSLAFLSPSDFASVRDALPPTQDAFWIPWGPSAEWAQWVAGVDSARLRPAEAVDLPYAFAIGKSKRDWLALAEAQQRAGFPLVVVAGTDCPVVSSGRVRVHQPAPGAREALTLEEVKALYRDATVVVLPLVEDESLTGSTALGVALASRSVVVMTATRAMAGFAEPYGEWVRLVPPGDVDAMAAAIERGLLEGRPTETPELPTAERFEEAILRVLRG